ncbi:ExeM/NucH family extracellular endonuclease [bacterium]|nr:ExeM/NucH family extracellular endonuclease [bacterium]
MIHVSSCRLHCLFLTLTISALLISGCKPTTTVKIASPSENASTNIAASAAFETNESEKSESDNNNIVITGDLNSVDWNSHVGKQVVIEGDLMIVDTYDLARRGQIKVARNRLHVPTTQVDPNDTNPDQNSFEGGSNVAKVTEAQKRNDGASIIIDDDTADQNVFPLPLFPELGKNHPTVRLGSIVHGVSGRVTKQRNSWVIQSDKLLQWSPQQRPERPDLGDADITIASFNVLNYFTTIDDGQNDARGADSESELSRQEAKITAAIQGLQADVIGLMELENNINAEERLIAALNNKLGKNVYEGCGIPKGFDESPGGDDSIRVGIIYRADRVSPVGEASIVDDEAFSIARTPIVQTFVSTQGGRPFTVIVNHFKSKGGASSANAANKDKGDGQAAYNAARRGQSLAICDYIKQNHQNTEQSRVLVIGDLNAYQQEDPIDALRANGLVDLHDRVRRSASSESVGTEYTFVYYAQSGSLDHAFATASLAADVTGVSIWHINADEPRFMDYNQEFNPEAVYSADPYRSSDHDPVLIGIRK